ncbi:MAG: hypothetical protein JO048_04805 [Methylobacteriaceae bacterium]|nr:hypothetical protein [Methylobacteriaceae bacterium]
MRGERTTRASIREERLRATAGLRGSDTLSSWRGRSGRRYVVGVQSAAEVDPADEADAVLIAVERRQDGSAAVVDVAAPACGSARRARQGWLAAVRARGATEIHVHRLAETDAERRAVLEDLVGSGG